MQNIPLNFIPFPGWLKILAYQQEMGFGLIPLCIQDILYQLFMILLIAKLICWGNNRHEAIEKMKDSLLSFRISGIPSTIPFHISALNDTRFNDGCYDTSFVNKLKSFSVRDGDVACSCFLHCFQRVFEFLKGIG